MAQILTLQPFPFTHYDAEAGSLVPCGITSGRYVQGTASEMMRLYWKVKRFSVSGSYTNYQFNDPEHPQSAGYSGSVDSDAETEIDLVCGAGTTSYITPYGSITDIYLEIEWVGSDFYFNSSPNQEIVKLYGNMYFEANSDDSSGIATDVGGSLSPFTIDGFQVYENGSAVNYKPTYFLGSPLITDFSASIVASDFWPYKP
jgi:hypothetical protein